MLATALGMRRDPTLREEMVYAWALVVGIVGMVGMVGSMVWYGAFYLGGCKCNWLGIEK